MKKTLSILSFLLIILSSCSDEKNVQKPRFELPVSQIDFPTEASEKTIQVESNLNSVKIEIDDSWCKAIYHEQELIISTTENLSNDIRSTKIAISSEGINESLTVRQLGAGKEILASQSIITAPTIGETYSLEITSNVDYSIQGPDWVTCLPTTKSDEMVTKSYTLAIDFNIEPSKREGKLIIQEIDGEVSTEIIINQKGMDDYDNEVGDDILNDIKLTVVGGSSSSYQPGSGIEQSFDGDYNTIYHSKWANGDSDYFPITLTYELDQADVDYLVYHPRKSGANGNFQKVKISAKTNNNQELEFIKEIDFKGVNMPTKVSFEQTLTNVTEIVFEVLSGSGDGQGFAACAEMEFFQFNPDNFDYLSLFTDHSCSSLRNDITLENIQQCPNDFFKNIALLIYHNRYPKEFRIDEFKAWLTPDIQAKELKTNPYSLRDNPTGISVRKGEELIVFVEDTYGENVGLFIQNLDVPGGDGFNNGSAYPLSKGINRFTTDTKGLVYVMYHSDQPKKKKAIKIHFATGTVSGYYDTQKHDISRWKTLLDNAKDPYFDVLGKYAHLVFPTARFRKHTNNLHNLIELYDELVYEEAKFMGLEKYNKMFENRHYFQVMYTSYMYATAYRTCYNDNTLPSICNEQTLKASPWGPAHEVGHCNQTRPGLKWIGMTEVTNNIHSLHIQTLWGNRSRLIEEDRYGEAHSHVSQNPNGPFCALPSVFAQLVPFWQLHLYLSKAQNMPDFYKDIHETVRTSPNPLTEGDCQIEFVKTCMKVSQLNLIDFFSYWGFLTAVNVEIDDYGKKQLEVTQEQVDELKAWVKQQNYPKPKHDFTSITDENVNSFK